MQLTVAMNGDWHAQPIEAYQLIQRAGELQHIAPARSHNVGARMQIAVSNQSLPVIIINGTHGGGEQ